MPVVVPVEAVLVADGFKVTPALGRLVEPGSCVGSVIAPPMVVGAVVAFGLGVVLGSTVGVAVA